MTRVSTNINLLNMLFIAFNPVINSHREKEKRNSVDSSEFFSSPFNFSNTSSIFCDSSDCEIGESCDDNYWPLNRNCKFNTIL